MNVSRSLWALLVAAAASLASTGCVTDGVGQLVGGGGRSGDTVDLFPNCGNGRVDPDEQCEITTPGCAQNCHWICDPAQPSASALCSDGDACNGAETCDATTHTCKAGTPAANGTLCGDVSICSAGKCVLRSANCGDKYIVAPEECDDGNKIDGDGCDSCRFSCVSGDKSRDCTGDLCAKPRTCDNLAHKCSPLQVLPDTTACSAGALGTPTFKACFAGSCVPCGNGVVDSGEECDDGNQADGDGCDKNCKFTCLPTDSARDCSSINLCLGKVLCDTTTHTCPTALPKTNGTFCLSSTLAGGSGNCIAGACVAPTCGDGYVANQLETCDDGNLNPRDGCRPDCSYSCSTSTASADCTTPYPTTTDSPLESVPACNKATCDSNHICSYAADPSRSGLSCNTTNSSGTCDTTTNPSYGACTSAAGKCGDGILDTGEECDKGTANNTAGSGCEPTCQWTCHGDSDCDDRDPCNGTETCPAVVLANNVPRKCVSNNQTQPDLTACGTGRICRNGGCAVSICGDGLVNTAAGEQCDPPNTSGCDATCKAIKTCSGYDDAYWSNRNEIPVTWGGGLIAIGTGKISQITLAHAVRTNPGVIPATFSLDLRPCSLSIPDFGITTDPTLNLGPYAGEKYGVAFTNVFNKATRTFQSSLTLGSLSPGAKVDISQVSLLMGLTMDNPYGAWPPAWTDLTDGILSPYEQEDYDHDTLPGLTVMSKALTDATYMNPIVDISQYVPGVGGPVGRADQLYLSTRASVTQGGTLQDCNNLTGTAQILYIDTHIVGCHRAEAGVGACTPSNVDLVDSASPKYTVVGTSTFTAKYLAVTPDPTNPCAAAVAAYP